MKAWFEKLADRCRRKGNSRLILDREGVSPYLERFYLTPRWLTLGLFRVVIHRFWRSDNPLDGLHDHTLRGDGFDASEDGTGRGIPLVAGTVTSKWAKGTGGPSGDECQNLVAIAIQERALSENPDSGPQGAGFRDDGTAYTLEARPVPQAVAFNLRGREGGAQPEPTDVASLRASSGGSSRTYVGFAQNQRDEVRGVDVAGALASEPGMKQQTYANTTMGVRRLTPRECERLQGFPDDYTLVQFRGKLAADGNRYKALGNSMAVPVMRWIGERIQKFELVALSVQQAGEVRA